jgi:osmotically-inducible protein OsmY
VAAGALGLVRPAAAQHSPYQASGQKPATVTGPVSGGVISSGPAVHGPIVSGPGSTGTEEHVSVVSPAHTKLEEMKVDLAWHADLVTFSYELGARIAAGEMEVRGFVPNEAVKEKAMQIARQHTVFPVKDKLKLMPTLAARTVGRPAEEVKEEAAQLLAERMGEEARSFDVKVTPVGEVTLGGTVHSVEEKLAASHLLRQVRGCGCVVNRLTVAPTLRDGRTTTSITRDGKETIGGQLPDLDAVVETDGLPAEGRPILSSQPLMGHVPMGQPVKRTLPMKTIEKKTPFATDSVPTTVTPPDGSDLPPPRVVPPVPGKPTTLPSGLPSTRLKPVPAPVPAVKKDDASDPLAAPDLPPSWSKKATGSTAKPSEFATTGRDSDTGKVVPASSKTEPKADKPKSDKPAGYYETTGMVLFDDEPRSALPPSQAVPMQPSVLKQRVEAVCGKQAKSVQVVVEPDSSLRVKVKVSDPEQERILTQRILAMPEMTSPRIHLEMMPY